MYLKLHLFNWIKETTRFSKANRWTGNAASIPVNGYRNTELANVAGKLAEMRKCSAGFRCSSFSLDVSGAIDGVAVWSAPSRNFLAMLPVGIKMCRCIKYTKIIGSILNLSL